MKWISKLMKRWEVESVWQVLVIMIVFACTGTTVLLVKPFILHLIFGTNPIPTWAGILYYLFIPVVYNILLLSYGFIFGQFQFFWRFEKRFLRNVGKLFGRGKTKQETDRQQKPAN